MGWKMTRRTEERGSDEGDLGNTVKDEQVCRIPLNGIPTQPVE